MNAAINCAKLRQKPLIVHYLSEIVHQNREVQLSAVKRGGLAGIETLWVQVPLPCPLMPAVLALKLSGS
jgi:hypothetical protein